MGAGGVRRGAAHALVLGGVLGSVLTGCSTGPEAGTPPRAPSPTATAGAPRAVARSGGTIGAAGSACALPVTFDVAPKWKAKAVRSGTAGKTPADRDSASPDAGAQELVDALLRQGPVTVVCEIDAKPAGNIGFLRVWTAGPGSDDARTVLEEFVAAEDGASGARYRTFTAGGLDGVEVGYHVTNEFLDGPKEESALAVVTGRGPVVLHLGGLDGEEHEQMLPAYELAKKTLRAS
ncbi:lipoprotein [Streptomyces sp. NPDC046831]|uniref:lipoprotein n=1 Tax=Streptomyces sp. NPDC046831 TaxID=3154805 RepID=UPI003402EFDE